MAREDISRPSGGREVHSDDTKIEQKPNVDADTYSGDIVFADRGLIDKDYAAELAFMEEPVLIRLEPSSSPNAISSFAVWCNGQGAEIHENGRWWAIGWLPVGREITIKRKVLEIIARTKIDTVHTIVKEPDSEHPHNEVQRFTSAVHSFSVLSDANPKGAAWLTEMRRRNF